MCLLFVPVFEAKGAILLVFGRSRVSGWGHL